jgi:hypothetical protein
MLLLCPCHDEPPGFHPNPLLPDAEKEIIHLTVRGQGCRRRRRHVAMSFVGHSILEKRGTHLNQLSDIIG